MLLYCSEVVPFRPAQKTPLLVLPGSELSKAFAYRLGDVSATTAVGIDSCQAVQHWACTRPWLREAALHAVLMLLQSAAP